MIDLTASEPESARTAHLYWVVSGKLMMTVDVARPAIPQIPTMPAQRLRHDPDCHFLGLLQGVPCYVCDWSPQQHDDEVAAANLEPLSLRDMLHGTNDSEFSMASRALQYLTWRQSHSYCCRCGHRTRAHPKELAMICDHCHYRQYPRISPCIITVIHDGPYVLLGRAKRFPEGMYSCLAGFIEAGESAEQAVKREVFEEAGVEVGNLTYVSSQSWPFPHSLMLGFYAQYEAGQAYCRDDELVDIQWFRYDQLPQVPPSGSIAHLLIQQWVTDASRTFGADS